MSNKTNSAIEAEIPVYGRWMSFLRYLPWTSEPWEDEEWKVVRHSLSGVMWRNFKTGAEVHASKYLEKSEPGWQVIAVPDDEAPVGEAFYPELTPEPTDRKTAIYLAEQYMKHDVGLVDFQQVKSLNPPRLEQFQGGKDEP